MNCDWPMVRIADVCDTCLGKMLDQNKNRGVYKKYLGNSNVRWGAFDLADLSEMRFEQDESERYGIHAGDLIICEGGEPGRCAIWNDELPDMMIQKALHRVRAKDNRLLTKYLYYRLLWAGKNSFLDSYFTGTTIKHLTGRALAEISFPLPSVKIQRAMISILSCLDDKIELNNRINKTLEQMAQAIFMSFFVKSDYSIVKLKHLCDFKEGYVNPSQNCPEYFDGAVKWLRAVDINESFIINTSRTLTDRGFSSAGKSAYLFEPNTIAISKSGTIGRLGIVSDFMCGNRAVINIKPKDGRFLPFIYQFLKSRQDEYPRAILTKSNKVVK